MSRPVGSVARDLTSCSLCSSIFSIDDLDTCIFCTTDFLCLDCMLMHDCVALHHQHFIESVDVEVDVMLHGRRTYTQYQDDGVVV